jgi:Mce-associated membrane protein
VPAVPTWALAVVGVLAALVAGLAVYLWNQPSEASVAASVSDARGAAEQAVAPLLSYDYRNLDQTEQAAHDVMTSDYRERYDQLFAVIEENAPSTRTVVRAESVAAAVVRADGTGDRVEILVFVDQARTNRAASEPEVFRNQARLTMQRVDGEWLVDDVVTSPAQQ